MTCLDRHINCNKFERLMSKIKSKAEKNCETLNLIQEEACKILSNEMRREIGLKETK